MDEKEQARERGGGRKKDKFDEMDAAILMLKAKDPSLTCAQLAKELERQGYGRRNPSTIYRRIQRMVGDDPDWTTIVRKALQRLGDKIIASYTKAIDEGDSTARTQLAYGLGIFQHSNRGRPRQDRGGLEGEGGGVNAFARIVDSVRHLDTRTLDDAIKHLEGRTETSGTDD